MTTPITATVTRPEPPPEPARPRLYVEVFFGSRGWAINGAFSYAPYWPGSPAYRLITIPTDAEAEAHARYVAALEAEAVAGRRVYANAIDGRKALVVGYNADVLSYEDAQQRTDSARAEWEAEGGKA